MISDKKNREDVIQRCVACYMIVHGRLIGLPDAGYGRNEPSIFGLNEPVCKATSGGSSPDE